MKELTVRVNRGFYWALAISLAAHIIVFSLKLTTPPEQSRDGGSPHRPAPIAIRLQKQKPLDVKPAQPAPPPPSFHKRPVRITPRVMTAPPSPVKIWSRAQSNDVDQFMNDLAIGKKTASAAQPDISQRAFAMARDLGAAQEIADNRDEERQQTPSPSAVDRFSLDMYFDALNRKLNRSAEMVKRGDIEQGRQIAALSVVLNADGTVKSFRILYAADQTAVIAYIKSVFDRAAPFSPFPPDIRKETDSLTFQICIMPNRYGDSSGSTFVRMSKSKGCRG